MTNIQLKRSATAGNVPSSLEIGEVAINEADTLLWHRNASGVVVPINLDGAGDRNLIVDASFLVGAAALSGAEPWTIGTNGYSNWFWNRNFLIWNNTNQSLTVSIVDGPFKTTKALRFTFASTPTSGDVGMWGPRWWGTDGLALQSGRMSSMSFYFKAASDTYFWAQHEQNFGTGGSTKVTTVMTSGTHTGSANWSRKAGTVLVPSIAGKTIGTDNYNTDIYWSFVPRATGNYDIACLQFQDGPLTPFLVRSSGLADGVAIIRDQASPTFDAQNGRTRLAILIATGNRTLAIPTGTPQPGQLVNILHNAFGGDRTLSLTTGSTGAFAFGSTIGGLSMTSNGYWDVVNVMWDTANWRWRVIGYMQGFTTT